MWRRRFEKEDAKVAKASELGWQGRGETETAAAAAAAKEELNSVVVGAKREQGIKKLKDLDTEGKAVMMRAKRDKILGRLAMLGAQESDLRER
jgi:hypothetical protein